MNKDQLFKIDAGHCGQLTEYRNSMYMYVKVDCYTSSKIPKKNISRQVMGLKHEILGSDFFLNDKVPQALVSPYQNFRIWLQFHLSFLVILLSRMWKNRQVTLFTLRIS